MLVWFSLYFWILFFIGLFTFFACMNDKKISNNSNIDSYSRKKNKKIGL